MAEQPRRLAAGEALCLAVADATAVLVATAVGGLRWSSLVAVACSVVALAVAGLYRDRLTRSALDDLPRAVLAVAVAWGVTSWTVPPVPALPAAALWWWLVVAGCVLLARALAHVCLRRRRASRPQATVVVGAGNVAVRLAEVFLRRPEFGLRPVGFVGPPPAPDGPALPRPLLGPVSALDDIVSATGAMQLIVAFPAAPDAELVAALRRCRQQGRTVFLVPRLFELNVDCVGAEAVDGLPVVRLRPEATHQWGWLVKRPLDVIGAGIALLLLAPLLLACAVAVRHEVGRNDVLFRQQRVGWRGRRFWMMKFRSLRPGSDAESHTTWTVGDHRLGPVGRLIRRTSLDELPQLINVLRGDMSLVGPRPERPFFVELFRSRYRCYTDRLRVPAGMTGWAQIHGLRGDTSIEDRARYDNYYIENWSLGLDLKILLRTVVAAIQLQGR
jgi:exopolysaccharide biosynthesis polyprenyl glycosylphosphotransferase